MLSTNLYYGDSGSEPEQDTGHKFTFSFDIYGTLMIVSRAVVQNFWLKQYLTKFWFDFEFWRYTGSQ